jgi:hypothetical protein
MMRYYEVLLADTKYKSGAPLTYSSDGTLEVMSVVTCRCATAWLPAS